MSALGTYHFIRPVVTSVFDPTSRTGYTQQWNVTMERQIRPDLAVSASYVGSHSVRIMATYQSNPAVYGPGATDRNTDSRRLYPGLGQLAVATPWGFSNYNGLQLQVTKRSANGLGILANYVYSRCMDNTSAQVQGADAGGGAEINKFSYRADYARCDFDITHTANASLIYPVPQAANVRGALGELVNGWTITAIVTARSGRPLTVFIGVDSSLTGLPNNDTADQISPNPGRPAGADPLKQWFNTSAFRVNAAGTFGTAGRNSLAGATCLDRRRRADEAAARDARFGLRAPPRGLQYPESRELRQPELHVYERRLRQNPGCR